jgi:hypothetical protein
MKHFMCPKSLLCLLLLITNLLAEGQTKKPISFIDPTGSYKLHSKTEVRDGDTYGYFGEMNVKLLPQSKIAISFFICRGATAYTSGSFIDTLSYEQNMAIHRTPEDDTTCKIVFNFARKGVSVLQYQANLNSGCGFGHGVLADGYYKKTSGKVPKISDLLEKYDGTNGILKD